MALAEVALDDKYTQADGRIYLTGSQALVRLAIVQSRRDRAAGLDTACLVTGYRGSPMHNVDRMFWSAANLTAEHNIHFQPAINEDLAATAIWGSQQAQLHGDARYDGVYAIWYGKAPGLDRSLDAIRHANLAGTSTHGGVLAMVGDDPAMMATDTPAVSELTFADLMMPMLYPASVAEVIELGLLGWAMSRYCGAWVGFKAISDAVDTAASIDGLLPRLVVPEDFEMPPDGLNIRPGDNWRDQEARQTRYKLDAALAFARANEINRPLISAAGRPRYVVIGSGKAAVDAHQALRELGVSDRAAAELGITLYQIAMPHPIDGAAIRALARGAEEVVVVEEKRRLVESQVKDALYGLADGERPRVVGRTDEAGAELLPAIGELSPDAVARALARRIDAVGNGPAAVARLALIEAKAAATRHALDVARTTTFCSGCPHNTSTRVPEGSRAHGGVGCHFMAVYMDRATSNHTHMGGEGATWIGQAPFVKAGHIFQNLGDGTYYHSGLLAIRAAVAAGVNITYKVLFNDAVAMTGGQPHDGPLTPALISKQVHAEGAGKIVVVSDEPDKYPTRSDFAPGTAFEHRHALDRVQRECRDWTGVSVIIYDQTCAAEKRRRRKRGAMVDPARRVFINDLVCEGCGDCNAQSSCISVLPHDTEFGRKRRIDQSSCNKDYTCADGFCPSFVSVVGGVPKRAAASEAVPAHLATLPAPALPRLDDGAPYAILVTGVGGTGVATIGALLTMAAHLEGLACAGVDQFGMAQKGGPVTSHVQIARQASDIRTVRLTAGGADLVLACDKLVAAGDAALATVAPGTTRVVVNTNEAITGQFTRQPDLVFPSDAIARRLVDEAGPDQVDFVDATRLATALMGDAIAANLFLLGHAWQQGLVPLSGAAIARAIELNGVAVAANQQAFEWGRRAAVDIDAVTAAAAPATAAAPPVATLDDMVARRIAELTAYQDAAYAARYAALVERAGTAERAQAAGFTGFAEAVARYAYKLMAYKDEYEVARLYTDGRFAKQLAGHFEGTPELRFHLAPPLLSRRDRETGLPAKRAFGPWMAPAMRLLARLKGLRGTRFDPFGYSVERRTERQLIADYTALIEELCDAIEPDNHALAVALASVPEKIRGYGYVKQRHLDEARQCEADLLAAWRSPTVAATAAE